MEKVKDEEIAWKEKVREDSERAETLLAAVLGGAAASGLISSREAVCLGQCASLLETPDSECSSIIGAALREQHELFEATVRERKAKRAAESARAKLEKAVRVKAELEESTRALSAAAEARSQQDKDLIASAATLRARSAQLGAAPQVPNPPITHSEIVEMARELEEIEKAATAAEDSLACFADLPADVTMAKLAVQEARQRLSELDSKLSGSLGQLI